MRIGIFGKIAALFVSAVLGLSAEAQNLSVDKEQRSFTIRTERLEATFKDGVIIGLKNLATGELICDKSLGDTIIPKGFGSLSEGVEPMKKTHGPWGCVEMNQQVSDPASAIRCYHHPGEKSTFNCAATARGARATWTGLGNGAREFPSETLTVEAEVDDGGALSFRAWGKSEEGGIFGVVVPLANINPESKFYLSSFGGMSFKKMKKPALITLGTAPFQEAPVMAAETGKGSFAIWKEDGEFHPYFTFLNWSGKSFAFAFEHNNLMPFEPRGHVSSATWRLDVFDGGWMKAMIPYKNWYSKFFEKELRTRDAVKWADKIRVVTDIFRADKAVLEKVSGLFPPETVMFQDWHARAPAFGTEWPDWTPRKGYVERVRLLHDYGFKTMGYVLTYCVTYNSPVFVRDNLREKVLTRKASLWNYGGASKDKVMDNLVGDTRGFAKKDQFEGMRDGAGIYSDPLCSAWRKYHVDQMKWWNSTTGTDANYEDTAGCSGDFGNGVVDGKHGAQGSVAMMRELLECQPGVPMSSEYGPDTIAFAIKWPLEYAQVWGNNEFRAGRMHRQHPVNAFLFGHTVWIPVANTGNDFLKHVVTACSDAAGGMGMVEASLETLNCDRGFTGHLKWRSQVFAGRGLKPYFDPEIREENLVCQYKDKDGGVYKYLDDGRVQRMVGPDGRDLYARVENTDRIDTALSLPGWPAYSDNGVFGLNPKERYALFPKKSGEAPASVRLASLPAGVVVSRFIEDESHCLVVLDKTEGGPESAELTFELNRKFDFACVNDKARPIGGGKSLSFKESLPARVLFSSSSSEGSFGEKLEKDLSKITIKRVSRSTGLVESVQGKDIVKNLARPLKAPGVDKPVQALAFMGAGAEGTADFLVRVPSRDAAVKIYVQNMNSTPHGDCTIAKVSINGKLVKALNSKTKNEKWKEGMPEEEKAVRDNSCHEWIFPLGEHSGNNVLVTISSDPKADNNCDQQWISIPTLVRDEEQKVADRVCKAGQ